LEGGSQFGYEAIMYGLKAALLKNLAFFPRESPVENISREGHPHRDLSTALRSGRDDKGEGGASMDGSCECRDGRALLAAEKLWLVRDEEKASLVGEALS
jgi:hypothetical protein